MLKLPFARLLELREKHDKLDDILCEYEDYLEENGLPYCDYKLHRNNSLVITPLEKFKNGIKRILRIVRSYKSSALTDLLMDVQKLVRSKQKIREQKRKDMILKGNNLNPEQRNEQAVMMLTKKVDDLTEIVKEQREEINMMK